MSIGIECPVCNRRATTRNKTSDVSSNTSSLCLQDFSNPEREWRNAATVFQCSSGSARSQHVVWHLQRWPEQIKIIVRTFWESQQVPKQMFSCFRHVQIPQSSLRLIRNGITYFSVLPKRRRPAFSLATHVSSAGYLCWTRPQKMILL